MVDQRGHCMARANVLYSQWCLRTGRIDAPGAGRSQLVAAWNSEQSDSDGMGAGDKGNRGLFACVADSRQPSEGTSTDPGSVKVQRVVHSAHGSAHGEADWDGN